MVTSLRHDEERHDGAGKPTTKANVRQNTLRLFCARMPAKLMLANIHNPEMPVS
jgi:hypothetical protein